MCLSSYLIFYKFINDGFIEKEMKISWSKVEMFPPFFICPQFWLWSTLYLCVSADKSSSSLDDLHLSSCQSSSSAADKREGEILSKANVKSFTFSELKLATRNFRLDSVVGEGGFGSVYRGCIDQTTLTPTKSSSGLLVAVKSLNPDGFQGHREWLVHTYGLFNLFDSLYLTQFYRK